MNLDDFQKSWQTQDAAGRISVNADGLLAEVRRRQRHFHRMILLRDVREIGVAFLLVPLFVYGGWKNHWTLYLSAFGCLVVGADMWLGRLRHRRQVPDRGDSLKASVRASLAEVNHQIWLLKSVLWNYILPVTVPGLLFFGWSTWEMPLPAWVKVLWLSFLGLFTLAIDGGIYWLNQFAVRNNLERRRRELEDLLKEIEPDVPLPAMNTKKPLAALLLVLAACAIAIAAHAAMETNSSPGPAPASGLESIREKYGVPALAVVVTKDGRICDRAAAGVRKFGDPTPVTTNDVFHIGSCTKSMTATLAAMFIEAGQLRWDTTIGEVFPEWKGRIDPRYETVTLDELLHHRGGVPAKPPAAAWARAWKEIGTPTEQRREYLEAVLRAPPAAEPGTKMIYSNDGYVLVGAMLEKISGQDFESLMMEKLFKPLQMETAGFGFPGTKGRVDEPWGHRHALMLNLPMQADNPPVHSPCGRVHCSLDDLARYAMFHLGDGTNTLLKPETLARLHAAPASAGSKDKMDNYACGWVCLKRRWAGGPVLWHNGSNTFFYIVMWLAPDKDFCVIAAANVGDADAEKACDDACGLMIHKWLPQ